MSPGATTVQFFACEPANQDEAVFDAYGFQRFRDRDGRSEARFLPFDSYDHGSEEYVANYHNWAQWLADQEGLDLADAEFPSQLLRSGIPPKFRCGPQQTSTLLLNLN